MPRPPSIVLMLAFCIFVFCLIALPATPAEEPLDVMAQVEVTTVHAGETRNEKFLFVRAGIRVERHEKHRSSIWTLRGPEQVELEEFSHDQRRVIEYTSADLEITGRAVPWEQLRFLLDPTLLTRCKAKGRRRALGRSAVRHVCQENEIRYRIDWLTELHLPVLIDARRSGSKTRLRVLEIHPLAEAPWDLPDLEGYERRDFADLGDLHDHTDHHPGA